MKMPDFNKYRKVFIICISIFVVIFIINIAVTMIYKEKFRATGPVSTTDETVGYTVINGNVGTGVNNNFVVKFKDENIERIIRFNLNKPTADIHVKDIKGIGYLNLNHCDIQNLSGMEYFFSLKKLDLSYNKISDLSELTKLKNLQELIIYNNKIKDVTELAKIDTLKKIDVSSNLITNVEPLTAMKNLVELDVNDNKITDVSPLTKLPKLKVLDVSRNYITNMDILNAKNFTQLLNWGNKLN